MRFSSVFSRGGVSKPIIGFSPFEIYIEEGKKQPRKMRFLSVTAILYLL